MPRNRLITAQKRAALIAAAKTETRPLADWCEDYGFTHETAAIYLRAAGVPFKGRKEAKQEKLLAMLDSGLDCDAIAKEMKLCSGWYVYYRLLKLGATPPKPRIVGNKHVIGGKRMSKEMPRNIKMLGDMKRGLETWKLIDKYGVCRERICQVRAHGVQAGLLP